MPNLTAALNTLSPEELAELDTLLSGPLSFRDFVSAVHPRYDWSRRHCLVLAGVLERILSGELKRVMVQMPPRHGKTLTVSQLFPAYYLRRYPERYVGVATYSTELSHIMSRAAQAFYQGHGEYDRTAPIGLTVEAVKHWETEAHGGLWATGASGPQTGKGFHLGIVDDPIKDAEAASSETLRRRMYEWWESTFYTRQEPGAAIIVINTRWHDRDLTGFLLEKEANEPEHWHIVDFAALYEGPAEYPKTCTVEPDWRVSGEALCPVIADAETLAHRRRSIGPYFFAALFQQRPRPREGGMFKREWFPIIDVLPSNTRMFCRGWDQGATAGGGDYTAGVRIAKTADGVYVVCDVVRDQWEPGSRDAAIRATASQDGKQCRIRGEQEPGASGKTVAQSFVRMLDGYTVRVTPSSGDKALRAQPFAAQCEGGNVKLLRGPWNADFIDELCAFPTGVHDDQVDAVALAFNDLASADYNVNAMPVSMTRESVWRR